MNVSLKWLGTLVDLSGLDPNAMAERLTTDGIPVEHVRYPGKGISGVKTGKITRIDKHPDADHLVVCSVDVGEGDPVQIVTGASNVRVGHIVPVALPGAHLPAKHDASVPGGLQFGDFKIKKSKLRGVSSLGMLCSCGELGLDANLFPHVNREGIMVLPEDTQIGADFHGLYDLDDTVYEMELTANRADCFSMIGMAHEVGAVFCRAISIPSVNVRTRGENVDGRAFVHIEEEAFCKRFCGCLLENVKIGRSPEWIENRLRSNNIRPINNVVDAANYVMLETGQPLHTYDYDRVAGHSLTCRHAIEGEMLRTLDQEDRILLPSDLIIADAKGPVCIAGVMGGLFSEVTESTTKVLLEAAVFDNASIRRTSRRLGLRSEASGRYERGVNPQQTDRALSRFCQILEEQGACTVAPGMLDLYPHPSKEQVLQTTREEINGYIGIDLSSENMGDILRRLRFGVREEGGILFVTVPSDRADLEGMPDLAEEVARIYGYENIPLTTPQSAIVKGEMTLVAQAVRKVQDLLAQSGLSQVVNYSFMDKGDLEKWNIPLSDASYEAIPVMNPISEEYPVMRTSLLPGLMHTLKRNLSLKNENTAIFETGAVYLPRKLPLKELPKEEMVAAGLLCGNAEGEEYPSVWREYDFYDVKGIMETLLWSFGIGKYDIRRSTHPGFHPGISADFIKDGKILISFGEVHPLVSDRWGLKKKVFGFVMSVAALQTMGTDKTDFRKIPKFPAVERDLALLVPVGVLNQTVERIIRETAGETMESLRLFDLYRGEQVAEGYKSMAYSLLFRAKDKTLTDGEVDRLIGNIIDALGKSDIALRL